VCHGSVILATAPPSGERVNERTASAP
jgi:hypothetical protein